VVRDLWLAGHAVPRLGCAHRDAVARRLRIAADLDHQLRFVWHVRAPRSRVVELDEGIRIRTDDRAERGLVIDGGSGDAAAGAAAVPLESDLEGVLPVERRRLQRRRRDRKSTRLNSSHVAISYAVFCLKKKRTTRRCTG